MKSIEEIYQSLLSRYTERTGEQLAEDCDLAVRLWAAAAQIQALYIQADWVLSQSFPQTAQGLQLEYHAAMRGIRRSKATRATGTLIFTVGTLQNVPVTIPAGTVCETDGGIAFRTKADAVIAVGAKSVAAAAEAVEAGSSGNVPADAVHVLTACPVAVTEVRNAAAFRGGSNAEEDEALRRRVLNSYRRLPNGANAMWYEQTAVNCTGVAEAKAVGRARGIGTVDVYITSPEGMPSQTLLGSVQEELQACREIAVDVQVKAPDRKTVNVTAAVKVKEGADSAAVIAAVKKSLTDYFGGNLLGKSVLLAELGSRIYAIDGVENYRLTAPAADQNSGATTLPVLGTLTVTKWEN